MTNTNNNKTTDFGPFTDVLSDEFGDPIPGVADKGMVIVKEDGLDPLKVAIQETKVGTERVLAEVMGPIDENAPNVGFSDEKSRKLAYDRTMKLADASTGSSSVGLGNMTDLILDHVGPVDGEAGTEASEAA